MGAAISKPTLGTKPEINPDKEHVHVHGDSKLMSYRTVGNFRGGLNFVYFRGP